MEDDLARRARAAAAAGWWTVLILAAYVTVGWGLWLAILQGRPGWLLTLWGGGALTWAEVQKIVLWFFAVIKLLLLAAIMLLIWLTLWVRRLQRADTP